MRDTITRNIQQSVEVKQQVLKDLVPVIEQAAQKVADSLKEGHKIIFFGNGGSASDSQHLAAEFVGRYEKERRPLPAISFTTDTSILTAVGNDYGYERVFERQVEALGRKGDVVFAITTSGNSKNVLLAVKKAKELGMYVIAFTGGTGGELKDVADLSVVIPTKKTSRIQECHIMIGHIICECVDEIIAKGQ